MGLVPWWIVAVSMVRIVAGGFGINRDIGNRWLHKVSRHRCFTVELLEGNILVERRDGCTSAR